MYAHARKMEEATCSLRLQLQASQGTASKSLTRRARQTGLPCQRRCTPESRRRRGTPWGSPLLWVVRGEEMGGSLIEEPERVACHGSRHCMAWHGMLCHAPPRHAWPAWPSIAWHGLCHSRPPPAMPCGATPGHAMPCHAMPSRQGGSSPPKNAQRCHPPLMVYLGGSSRLSPSSSAGLQGGMAGSDQLILRECPVRQRGPGRGHEWRAMAYHGMPCINMAWQ